MTNTLSVGQKAPEVGGTSIDGSSISSVSSGRWHFLSFHRFASCPFCVLRTHELIKAYPQFVSNDVEILSIWPSSVSHMKKYIGNSNAPFPLIADPNKKIYEKYGVTQSSKFSALKLILKPALLLSALRNIRYKIDIDADPTLLPAEFLVNPKGEIAIAHYGKHYGDHLPIGEIISSVRR